MAEVFSNQLTRAAGSVLTRTNSSVGAASTEITVSSNTGINVSDLIVNSNFIAGTKVHSINGNVINADRASVTDSASTGQVVKFLQPSNVYTSPSNTKSILIGGTFANNTNNSVDLTIELYDTSSSVGVALASRIPIPAGSSFIISDTGKTLLESQDELRVYCNTDNAIDVSLSILQGVN